jgi:hypothetical protein
MVAMNRAQQKSAQPLVAAKQQHIPRVRELTRQVLDLSEMTVKPLLQARKNTPSPLGFNLPASRTSTLPITTARSISPFNFAAEFKSPPSSLPGGQVGSFYSDQFQAASCNNNFTWPVTGLAVATTREYAQRNGSGSFGPEEQQLVCGGALVDKLEGVGHYEIGDREPHAAARQIGCGFDGVVRAGGAIQ